jgi:signal transduction histidine kinase
MNQASLDYQSYLLRLRRADNAGWPNWWASLESTTTGEYHSFADLDGLLVFLRAQTGTIASGATAQAAVALIEALQTGSSQASFHLARLLQADWDSALRPLAGGVAQRLGIDQDDVYQAFVDAAQDYQAPEGAGTSARDKSYPLDLVKLRQAEEALRRHNRELSLLNRAIQALSSSLDLDRVLANILEETLHLLNVAACSVWLIESETGDLVCRQAVGPGSAAMRGRRLALEEGITGQVARTGESLLVPDTQTGTHGLEGTDRQPDLPTRSIIGVPLRVEGSIIGVLQAVDDSINRFSPSDQILLQSLAAAAAIAIINASLVETLHQRTLKLQSQNEELDAFAHTVAHDLKSPLGLSIGFGRVLAQELADTQNPTVRECVDTIVQTGYNMNTIVDELLLLSTVRKMDAVALEPLDMTAVVAGAQQRLLAEIAERQVEIILPQAWPTALGYGPWIEEVWANLLSNAIKYGYRPEAGVPPRVELGFDRSPNRSPTSLCIRFWVRDNGPGLSVEEQQQLFTEFTRLHKKRAIGHGLGLSIVRRIMEKLGGEAGVESTPGQGSLFYFTLPVAQAPSMEEQQAVEVYDELSNRVSDLPHGLVERLAQAATRTDMAAVDGCISEIRARDATLGDSLTSLADDFAYDQILRVIQSR